jgi:hypothetical protein
MDPDIILSALALLSFLALLAAWVAVPHAGAAVPLAETEPTPVPA